MEKKLVYFFQESTSLPFIHKLLVFILIAVKKFFGLSSSCSSIFHEEEHHHHHHQQEEAKESNAATLERGDLGFILWRMGLAQSPDEVEMNEEAVSLPDLFAEEEPSLQELRQAFSVFDENDDGFIDDLELRRVLQALGVGEGLEVATCRRMIQVHDRNGDGRIDFVEFVRLMELVF
ncbi:probable calcium-binding protein CML46 [Zingiber officinale]|uniref:EF-hand domain-containing protein n=1 Tax=Zingiber officinale TaxID=94328 RepID=A0A8J5HR35_ZINOF|nr:probable calcium-binding protein CML46 [Zingiber officinale]KAG6531758.1 hypothetical protein ZIOFF_005578 [Zingiber officinale]